MNRTLLAAAFATPLVACDTSDKEGDTAGLSPCEDHCLSEASHYWTDAYEAARKCEDLCIEVSEACQLACAPDDELCITECDAAKWECIAESRRNETFSLERVNDGYRACDFECDGIDMGYTGMDDYLTRLDGYFVCPVE